MSRSSPWLRARYTLSSQPDFLNLPKGTRIIPAHPPPGSPGPQGFVNLLCRVHTHACSASRACCHQRSTATPTRKADPLHSTAHTAHPERGQAVCELPPSRDCTAILCLSVRNSAFCPSEPASSTRNCSVLQRLPGRCPGTRAVPGSCLAPRVLGSSSGSAQPSHAFTTPTFMKIHAGFLVFSFFFLQKIRRVLITLK